MFLWKCDAITLNDCIIGRSVNRQMSCRAPVDVCCKRAADMADNNGFILRMFVLLALFGAALSAHARHSIMKRNYSDQSVRGYLAERTCWWNEVCKEEFHSKFRCRCPRWSYCRAPGRYYDAHCSMTRTGYIWTQPETSIALEIDK